MWFKDVCASEQIIMFLQTERIYHPSRITLRFSLLFNDILIVVVQKLCFSYR